MVEFAQKLVQQTKKKRAFLGDHADSNIGSVPFRKEPCISSFVISVKENMGLFSRVWVYNFILESNDFPCGGVIHPTRYPGMDSICTDDYFGGDHPLFYSPFDPHPFRRALDGPGLDGEVSPR